VGAPALHRRHGLHGLRGLARLEREGARRRAVGDDEVEDLAGAALLALV